MLPQFAFCCLGLALLQSARATGDAQFSTAHRLTNNPVIRPKMLPSALTIALSQSGAQPTTNFHKGPPGV